MTISTTNRSVVHTGNGSNTSFPFSFEILSANDIVVTKMSSSGAEAVLASNYTVTLNPDQDAAPGGTVTYPVSGSALASNERLAITTDQAETQEAVLANAGGFFADTVEGRLDYLTMLVQAHTAILNRSMRAAVTDVNPNFALPSSVLRANKYLTFNSGGDPEMATTLPSGTLSASAIGNLLYPQSSAEVAAGVVPVNIYYPWGHIYRYGGTGDDSTNNATPIANAIAQMQQPGGAGVYFPSGVYRTNAAMTISQDARGRIYGDVYGKSQIKWTAGVNGLVVSGNQAYVSDIWFYGNNVGLTGLICHNTYHSVFARCYWGNWTQDGGRFNETFGAPTGNCNLTKFDRCIFNTNTGKGLTVPTIGSNTNAVQIHECDMSGNSSHGLLLKGQSWRVRGGVYEGNTGYGIQIAEDTDGVVSTKNIIEWPYLESNGSGGVRGSSKSQGNLIQIDNLNVSSDYSAHASAENLRDYPHNSSGGLRRLGQVEQGFQFNNVRSGGNRIQIIPDGTDVNIPFHIGSKGTEPLILQPNGTGPGVIVGGVTTTLNGAVILQLDSTSRGFLPPRMTTAQVNAISSPPDGTLVYDTDLKVYKLRQNSVWTVITMLEGTFTGTVTGHAADPTGTVNYRIANGICTLWITANIAANSNSTAMTMTGVPAVCQPASTRIGQYSVCTDNGVNQGCGGIITAGTITFYAGAAWNAAGFTNAATSKGLIAGWSMSYPL